MIRSILLAAVAAIVALPLRGQAASAVTLGPGDVVRIEIWREKDLSGEFLVDDRGTVTLPLLGDRHVAGVPLDQLRDQLITDYRQTLRNPSITVTPLRRVTVLGEVNKPGAYLLDPTVSLAGAVAAASGTNPTGDLRRIRVVRNGTVVRRRVSPEASLDSEDVRSGDQIFVDRRGWVERNGAMLTSALVSAGLGIVTALILR